MIWLYDQVIGFSGHQSLSPETRRTVRIEIERTLSQWDNILAVTSLASGGDQIFAECALSLNKQLMVIIPCSDYETTFVNAEDLTAYRKFLDSAVRVVQLSFSGPSEEAYWAAGKRVVDVTDMLVAVWDGLPAGGLGGTADVVHYAENCHKRVVRIWPQGASRE